MKNKALIFLNGTYPEKHKGFYIDEYNRRKDDSVIIAADGGLRFLAANNLMPDIIVGDLDSIDHTMLNKFPKAKIIKVPLKDKASTDGELALQWCVENHISDVIIYGGIDTKFETDHLLGNILMMFALKGAFASIKMRDYCQEIIPIENETCSGNGNPGDMISVIPLSDKITYSATGLKYDPRGEVYKFGRTTPLRNELINIEFSITIKGRAIVIRHF